LLLKKARKATSFPKQGHNLEFIFNLPDIGFTSSNYNDSNIRHQGVIDAERRVNLPDIGFNEVKALYISRKAKKGEMNSHGIFSVQILGIHLDGLGQTSDKCPTFLFM